MRYQVRCTFCRAISSTNRNGFRKRQILGEQKCQNCGQMTEIAEEIEDD